jgi:WD40 repeat protein/tRNA A-37 threonylcarbamoyl transferase component Bud32
MSADDPTDTSDATRGDTPAATRRPDPTAGSTLSGGSALDATRTQSTIDANPHSATTHGPPDTRTSNPIDTLTADFHLSQPAPSVLCDTVPGYELLEKLGEGGMGVVWKARQTRLKRLVALKMVLGEHRAGAKELIRFLAEAEAVAAIKHPHVVHVYEYGDADGRPFLAMEYLSGGSLTDRLKESGRLAPKAAAVLVGTLAGAVQSAHDLGIVHRDLKPANVLFDEAGRAKVTDFGLAKRAGGNDLTATQAVMGTPAYMAPEQARGDTKFVGPQCDVYSLGVILYECLTGTRPFDAPDALVLLRRVAEDEPERPAKRVPGLPRDVELICLKCLAKDPAERYPTAEALAGDLGRFTAGEPVSVRSAGAVERASKWARRKPTLAAAYVLGVLAAALGGLGGTAVWQWRAAESARGHAEAARDAEKKARAEAEQQREKFERANYGRTIEIALQELREDNYPRTVALLESTRPDLRGWEWRYVRRLCPREPLTLAAAFVESVAFSPDGSRIVTRDWHHTTTVWDATSGAEVLKSTGAGESAVTGAAFSPDGMRIVTAYGYGNTVKVWDVKSGTELLNLKRRRGGERFSSAAFSRDGTRIVTTYGFDNTLTVWDAKTGAEVVTLQVPPGFAFDPIARFRAAFSPDSARIVTNVSEGAAILWDAKSGERMLTLKGHKATPSATFSRDGARIVTIALHDNTAKVWDAKTGSELLTLNGHTRPLTAAIFSPDGARIVTASEDNTAKVWDAKTGAEAFTLTGHTARVAAVTFSPDASRIITVALGEAKVWDATTGAEVLTMRMRNTWDTGVRKLAALSPDGTRIVTAGTGATTIWDLKGAEALTIGRPGMRNKPSFERSLTSAAFSPDGTRVLKVNTGGYPAYVADAKTGALLASFGSHPVASLTQRSTWVAVSRDGTQFITDTPNSGGGSARVFDSRTGYDLPLDVGMGHSIITAAFSHDGARIVTNGWPGTAIVWNAKTGKAVLTLRGQAGGVKSAAFSPDGARIVTVSQNDNTVKVWEATSGADVLTIDGHAGRVNSAVFSPDSGWIVTASADRTAKIWDAKNGAAVLILTGHTGSVNTAAFSPDSARIVTASADGTAKVWDARFGADLLTLKGGPVDSAAFSSDGARILTTSNNGTAMVWDATPITP